MKKYITEFIGTFFLVLTIGMTGNPLAIGAVLMVMVYAGGHISGAHYNPAITLAVLIRGRIKTPEALIYMITQFAAGALAALLVGYFKDQPAEAHQSIDQTKAIIAELLGTFALAYVVLNVATAKANAGNSYFGLAIGFTVLAMAFCFGDYSGGAFNPAVAVGASVMKAFEWGNIWIYLAGCFGGALLAALLFSMNNPEDK
ncbi:MAG: aquaporin [Chitinophagaceae bacterium]